MFHNYGSSSVFDCREVYAGLEKIECVIYKIEICSICGHNYNNGELCPHQKEHVYGAEVCKPYEEKYCNICGENMVYCEHKEGEEYGGVECKPWERCNICGNNYYDQYGACSHEKGEIYGGTVCSTYVIEVCNICAKNYYGGDCPHHEGAWYDEGYCELDEMTICNICGNNYYDQYGACSHWVGEEYGGQICTTSEKIMCSVCDDLYTNCAHIAGIEYKNVVYYFYMKGRNDQSKLDKADLDKIRTDVTNAYNYKNKISEVVRVYINSREDFDRAWNGLGKNGQELCCVYAVIMNMHGQYNEISNGMENGYTFIMNLNDISSINKKPVQRLLLLQCSAGNVANSTNNVASVFAKKITGKVLAGDGLVHNKMETDYVNILGVPSSFTSISDGALKGRYVYYRADDRGWFFYKYDWDRNMVNCTQASGNDYRIYQLINMF